MSYYLLVTKYVVFLQSKQFERETVLTSSHMGFSQAKWSIVGMSMVRSIVHTVR